VLSGLEQTPGKWIISTLPGDKVGLVSFDGLGRGTILGVDPPLLDRIVEIGARATAFEALGNEVVLQAHGGALFACWHKASPIRRSRRAELADNIVRSLITR